MIFKLLEIARAVFPVAACFYLLALAVFYFFQAKLVYFPSAEIKATPAESGLEYEPVSFTADDGVTLSGWFIPSGRARKTLLFCPGNAGNISDRMESIMIFHRMRLNVLIFDYRGYGASKGKPSEKGTYADAFAAWSYLVDLRKISPAEIIVFGRSLGGAVAARLASEQQPGALIVESSFTSLKELGAWLYPYMPVQLLCRFEYDTLNIMSRVKCPVLIVHSGNDEMIDISYGKRLFDAAGEPKEFLEISGSHNEGFIVSGEHYFSGIENFIFKLNKGR